MSMPEFPTGTVPSREDAINMIIASIAMEELGISHIINAEGEKLQYILGTLEGISGPAATIEDVLRTNESIQSVLQSAAETQSILRAKLQTALSSAVLIGPTGPTGPTGTEPFLSSYIEMFGTTQTLNLEEPVAFNAAEADIVGSGLSADNTTITIDRPGLYHVEWDVYATGVGIDNAVFGLVEEGELESGASGSVPGRISSGALINVEQTPYSFSLVCFTDGVTIGEATGAQNTAASIRVLRFADGEG